MCYLQVLANSKDVGECCLNRSWDGGIVVSLQNERRRGMHEKIRKQIFSCGKGIKGKGRYHRGKILNQQLMIIRKMDAGPDSHHTNGRFPCNVTHTEAILGIFRRLFLLTRVN